VQLLLLFIGGSFFLGFVMVLFLFLAFVTSLVLELFRHGSIDFPPPSNLWAATPQIALLALYVLIYAGCIILSVFIFTKVRKIIKNPSQTVCNAMNK
jgi:hypothetical protein